MKAEEGGSFGRRGYKSDIGGNVLEHLSRSPKQPGKAIGIEGLRGTYLDTSELAAYLGRTPQAIRDMVCRHKIPFRKPGGRLLFIKSEIDTWVQGSKGITLNELQKNDDR